MFILCHDKLRIRSYRTIHKLIIVRVSMYHIKMIIWRNEQSVWVVGNHIKDILREPFTCQLCKDFSILFKNGRSNTQHITPILERPP